MQLKNGHKSQQNAQVVRKLKENTYVAQLTKENARQNKIESISGCNSKKQNEAHQCEACDLLVPFTFRPMILLEPLGSEEARGAPPRPESSPELSIVLDSLEHINAPI